MHTALALSKRSALRIIRRKFCRMNASSAGVALWPALKKPKQIRDDIRTVKEAISAGRRVVCSLAPSFIADFNTHDLRDMETALKALGFSAVEETAVGAQLVSDACAAIMREHRQSVLITSCCPAINLLVQKYYPTMLRLSGQGCLLLLRRIAHCSSIRIPIALLCLSAPASPRNTNRILAKSSMRH